MAQNVKMMTSKQFAYLKNAIFLKIKSCTVYLQYIIQATMDKNTCFTSRRKVIFMNYTTEHQEIDVGMSHNHILPNVTNNGAIIRDVKNC